MNEWHPVGKGIPKKEVFPPDGKNVLTCNVSGEIEIQHRFRRGRYRGWCDWDDYHLTDHCAIGEDIRVVAWMELPEPYKESEDDG